LQHYFCHSCCLWWPWRNVFLCCTQLQYALSHTRYTTAFTKLKLTIHNNSITKKYLWHDAVNDAFFIRIFFIAFSDQLPIQWHHSPFALPIMAPCLHNSHIIDRDLCLQQTRNPPTHNEIYNATTPSVKQSLKQDLIKKDTFAWSHIQLLWTSNLLLFSKYISNHWLTENSK